MDIIMDFRGTQKEVWAASMDYLHKEPILWEAGENWSEKILTPISSGSECWIHLFHSGSAAYTLIAISNKVTSISIGVFLKGGDWDVTCIMEEASRIVTLLFQNETFRRRRSILLKLGAVTHKMLSMLDQCTINENKFENARFRMGEDLYQPLLDVDWIEDIMDGGTYVR
ncbi:hypothetical protein N6H14_16325 [Paenibacillus sp. CC-CFT747]|nr:hypothetical protein N6H14_16325 [Paenibacillus sp. CC-CFT747]